MKSSATSGREAPASREGVAAYRRSRADDQKRELVDSVNAALHLNSPNSIQDANLGRLLQLKSALSHGEGTSWETPEHWMSGNRSKVHMCVDVRSRIQHHLATLGDDETELDRHSESRKRLRVVLLDAAELLVLRYLVLLRMGPVGLGLRARNAPLRPSNIAQLAYGPVTLLAALGVSAHLCAPCPIDDLHSKTELKLLADAQVQKDVRPIESYGESIERELDRMQAMLAKGLWRDVPTAVNCSLPEVTRVKGEPEPTEKEASVEPHLPLPDDYISAMGARSLWFIEELGPGILQVADEVRTIWSKTANLALEPGGIAKRRRVAVAKLLKAHSWRDSAGEAIEVPPFAFRLPSLGKNSQVSRLVVRGKSVVRAADWPPRTLVDVLGLMNLLQMAHVFVTELSLAPRRGELLTLRRDCVVRTAGGLAKAKGRTYKLVERSGGKVRDWVLPAVAENAIEQQARLIVVAEQIGTIRPRTVPSAQGVTTAGTHLWGQLAASALSDPTEPLLDINRALCAFAEALGLDVRPGGQNLRSHRFRKTVARLVGLAIAEAPRVLMQVFGHSTVDSVLYYMLADRAFQLEVNSVLRAVRVAKATEVVEAMVQAEDIELASGIHGGYGGGAAAGLAEAVQKHMESLHESGQAWGANSARELAEIFTLQGREWLLVRPGVLCTKLSGQAGPCNKSLGRPEPSKCSSTCMHRLEEPLLRADTDSAIATCVDELSASDERRDTLMSGFWAGQVRMHVERFPDLKAKWTQHPLVAGVLSAVPA